MAIVTLTKTLSWDYEACELRSFRVQGTCAPAGSFNDGCADPAFPCNSTQSQQFVVNILACTVQDVCRKLKERGFVRAIASIGVFDGNCLTDVTPAVDDCKECCDFLIDENIFQTIVIVSKGKQHYQYAMSITNVIVGQFAVENSNGYYLAEVDGSVEITGGFAVSSSHYVYAMTGQVVLTGEMGVRRSFIYSMRGSSVTVVGHTQIGLHSLAVGIINVIGNTRYGFHLHYAMSGQVDLSSQFDITSTNHYYKMFGLVDVDGNFSPVSNDLGEFDFVTKIITEVEEIGVTFNTTPADSVLPLSQTVSSCCSVPISTFLELKHNLGDLLSLSRFLLRNNLSIPNGDNAILPLLYNPRMSSWQTNLHYRGQSADYNGIETWNILFELQCSNQTEPDSWQFMMFVRKAEEDGTNYVIRLLSVFDVDTLCTQGKKFDSFSFSFNVKNRTTFPSMKRPGIFYDEAGLFASSPSFNKTPELKFQISVAGVNRMITSDFSLEEPRSATVHVADSSGYSL